MVKALVLAVAALFLGACGGGGGGGAKTPPPAPVTVTGIAAAGKVVAGTVFLTYSGCSAPLQKATDLNGNYSFDVTGLSGPFMLKVDGTVNGQHLPQPLYSLAGSQGGTANINPVSSLIVANAAGGANLDTVFATKKNLKTLAVKLTQATQNVQANLKQLNIGYPSGVISPITQDYGTLGTLDSMLDSVTIVVTGSQVSINGGAPLDVVSNFVGYSILGRITSIAGGGVASATVKLSVNGTQTGSATTAADGSFSFPGLLPGTTYTVVPTVAGYQLDRASSAVTVAGADVVLPDFLGTPNPGAMSISGLVTSANGNGVAGVTVTASHAGLPTLTTTTNAYGYYRLPDKGGNPANTTYQVNAYRSVYPPVIDGSATWAPVTFTSSAPQGVTINNNAAVVNFAASSLSTYTVSGQVVDLYGAPMAGVQVNVMTTDATGVTVTSSAVGMPSAAISAVTDANGRYSIPGLPSAFYDMSWYYSAYDFAVQLPNEHLFIVNGADKTINLTGTPQSMKTGGLDGSIN